MPRMLGNQLLELFCGGYFDSELIKFAKNTIVFQKTPSPMIVALEEKKGWVEIKFLDSKCHPSADHKLIFGPKLSFLIKKSTFFGSNFLKNWGRKVNPLSFESRKI